MHHMHHVMCSAWHDSG